MDEQATKTESRNALGQYQKGHAGGPGRRRGSGNTGARRVEYVQATYESVSIQEWKAIVAKAKRDALGVKIVVSEGRSVVIDDPESLGVNRSAARIFLRDAVIGRPAQYIHVESDTDAASEFDSYSDAELRAIAGLGGDVRELSNDELVDVARGIDTTAAANSNRDGNADTGAGAPDSGGTGSGT